MFKKHNVDFTEAKEKLSACFSTARFLSQKWSINLCIISKEMALLYNHHYKNVDIPYSTYIEW